jgi:hypothetical protein
MVGKVLPDYVSEVFHIDTRGGHDLGNLFEGDGLSSTLYTSLMLTHLDHESLELLESGSKVHRFLG